MILRRVTEQLKAQNWFAVALDYVGGVFTAVLAVRLIQSIILFVRRVPTVDPRPFAKVRN